jgi:hypothetical protein
MLSIRFRISQIVRKPDQHSRSKVADDYLGNLPQSGIQKHLSVLSKPQIIVLHLWSEIMVQKLAEERTSLGKGEVL